MDETKAMADAFRAYSRGRAFAAPVQTLGAPPLPPFPAGGDSQACIKSGYVEGDDVFVVRSISFSKTEVS